MNEHFVVNINYKFIQNINYKFRVNHMQKRNQFGIISDNWPQYKLQVTLNLEFFNEIQYQNISNFCIKNMWAENRMTEN